VAGNDEVRKDHTVVWRMEYELFDITLITLPKETASGLEVPSHVPVRRESLAGRLDFDKFALTCECGETPIVLKFQIISIMHCS
jgi:hypothetical protein